MKDIFISICMLVSFLCLPLLAYAESPDPPTSKLEQLKSILPSFEHTTFMADSDCPDIVIVDLRNVPGFSQLDDLTICGAADTLSLIIYSGALGDIKGFELSLIHI